MKLVHQGQDVYVNEDKGKFFVAGEDMFQEVPEATVAEGEYPKIPEKYVHARFKQAGLPDLELSGAHIFRKSDHRPYWLSRDGQQEYRLRDGSYAVIDFNKANAILKTFKKYERPYSYSGLFIRVLQILRVGTVVTPESFKNGAAKGETSPPYTLQDHVEWKMRGKMMRGVIKKWASNGASIICEDEKKRIVAFSRLTRIDPPEIDASEYEDKLGQTVVENFKSVLAAMESGALGVYRALVVQKKYSHANGREFTRRAAQCPHCVGELVEEQTWAGRCDRFQCSSCGTFMTVLKDNTDEVFLARVPKAKINTFCIEEARCCANCGRFHFEYGREGKRSTGFCRDFKVTVLAHNTCKGWLPDDPEQFGKNLTQQIRNLGTAISTHWNKESKRPYTKDDQKKDKAVATDMRVAYEKAYQVFMKKALEIGSKVPPTLAP
jgi:hypothetical protein